MTLSDSGDDKDLFSVDSSGKVTFNTAPDFENPTDTNKDNNYIFTATAKDSAGNEASQTITITVTDYINIFQTNKFQSDDIEASDNFGNSVAIDGDFVVVGAYKEDTNGSDAGSAYIFKKGSDGTLTQIAKIIGDDTEANDYFGISVAIEGDYIVVGAYGEDTNGISAGSAYIFKKGSDDNFTQIAKIHPEKIGGL